MAAYYNEFDAKAAAWLRELVAAGHLPAGDVDSRDIRDILPSELSGYDQCHFFAGIGGWALALRLAGWPDDRPVWTGSCPCQPFSAAGRGGGFADERHLWPAFFHLIRECRPERVFGEQVASPAGLAWLDLVHSDMEGEGYAVGAADLCAAGVGAPHIRQRIFWVADDLAHAAEPRWGSQSLGSAGADGWPAAEPRRLRDAGRVADADAAGLGEQRGGGILDGERPSQRDDADRRGALHELGDASGAGLPIREREELPGADRNDEGRTAQQSGRSPWADVIWLPCRDGKARPTQPGLFPLAHGLSGRVGKLRGYGNAIVPEVAAEFILASEGRLT